MPKNRRTPRTPSPKPFFSLARGLPLCAAVLGLCILLKWHFAEADALRLDWLLRPTSFFVSLLSGLSFQSMDCQGYYNAAQNILIAPACSGQNFFFILLATGGCMTALCRRTAPGLLPRFAGLTAAAYAATITVNTLRILLAVYLYRRQPLGDLVSPEQLHRIEGVVVYYVCLWLFAMLPFARFRKTAAAKAREDAVSIPAATAARVLLPLGCYLLFTLGLPLANGAAAAAPQLFASHSLTVLSLSAGLTLGFYLLCRKKRDRRGL